MTASHAQVALLEARPHAEAAARELPQPLRICHVMLADLWAGAEVQLATTAAYLATRPDVTLSVVLLNEGRLAHELRRLGVSVTVVDETRTSSAAIFLFLARFLRAGGFDIVHTHQYKDTVLGAAAARVAGVPRVIRTVHGLREPRQGWQALKYRAYEALDKAALFGFADEVIAVSNHMAAALRESGYPTSMVTCIHNGIDTGLRPARTPEDVRRELGIAPGALLIGTAGRLVPVKGQIGLLRAASAILAQIPDMTLLIVGGGPLDGELRRAAAELGIDRACRFTGARDDVHDLMGAMDVFVLPSLSEGIPMALLEAMALGRPVVATRVGGVPEVIEDRVSGLLVPPCDERAIADACLALARNHEWARTMGEAASQSVSKGYSHDQSGRTLVETYQRLVSDRPVGAPRRIAQAIGRRLTWAVERRQMRRIRRRPVEPRRALRSARTIAFVCHGNIIRSPFAAHLIQRRLDQRSPVSIVSAGLAAVQGRPSHPFAIREAHARCVDLTQHAAAPVSADLVAASDVLFVMDVPQLVELTTRFPGARGKTFLLTCLAQDAPLEIADPVNGDDMVFNACFHHITRAIAPITHVLVEAASQR